MDASISQAIKRARLSLASKFPLKDEQRRCLEQVLNRRSVVAVLPTGFGKSLIYQLLPSAFDELSSDGSCSSTKSMVIVVSPLVSLMAKQVQRARHMGISSAKLECSSSLEADTGAGPVHLSGSSLGQFVTDVQGMHQYQLVFVSPEALLSDSHGILDEFRNVITVAGAGARRG